MKVVQYISANEVYPVYGLNDEDSMGTFGHIELTADELDNYKECCAKYWAWQCRIEAAEKESTDDL